MCALFTYVIYFTNIFLKEARKKARIRLCPICSVEEGKITFTELETFPPITIKRKTVRGLWRATFQWSGKFILCVTTDRLLFHTMRYSNNDLSPISFQMTFWFPIGWGRKEGTALVGALSGTKALQQPAVRLHLASSLWPPPHSPGSLLQIQNLRPHPRPADTESSQEQDPQGLQIHVEVWEALFRSRPWPGTDTQLFIILENITL